MADLTLVQKQGIDKYYSSMGAVKSNALGAAQTLDITGKQALGLLVKIMNDKASNGGKYPTTAEADVRGLVAAVKQKITNEALALIAACEAVTEENYDAIAVTYNIDSIS